MTPDSDRSAAAASKPDAGDDAKQKAAPDAKDDLKSLPMPELQAKLASSPDGLSQADADNRLTRYGPVLRHHPRSAAGRTRGYWPPDDMSGMASMWLSTMPRRAGLALVPLAVAREPASAQGAARTRRATARSYR
jgi:hypothetical protein